jgi:hypothetical protein
MGGIGSQAALGHVPMSATSGSQARSRSKVARGPKFPAHVMEETLASSAHLVIRGYQVTCIGRGGKVLMDGA